jgi:hypothetical protein
VGSLFLTVITSGSYGNHVIVRISVLINKLPVETTARKYGSSRFPWKKLLEIRY